MGTDCLFFYHADAPQAGIQDPAGTLGEGEDLGEAVSSEASEETGLDDLRIESSWARPSTTCDLSMAAPGGSTGTTFIYKKSSRSRLPVGGIGSGILPRERKSGSFLSFIGWRYQMEFQNCLADLGICSTRSSTLAEQRRRAFQVVADGFIRHAG